MTITELNRFARVCYKDGRPEALELAKEAMRRAAERADRD